jgi:WD40 repeat protein
MDIKILNVIGKNFRGSKIKLIEKTGEFFFLSGGFLISFGFFNKKVKSYHLGLNFFITAFDIQQNNHHGLILGQNNYLMLIDLKLKKIKSRVAFKNNCLKIKWSPVETFFAISTANCVQIWKISFISNKFSNISLLNNFIICCRIVLDLDWDQTGKFLISGGDDGSIRIFRLRNKIKIKINLFLLNMKEIQSLKIYSKQKEFWVLNRKNILKKLKFSQKKFDKQVSFFNSYSCKLKKEDGLLTVSEIKPESSIIIQGYASGILVFFEIPEKRKQFLKIFKKERYKTEILIPFKMLDLLKFQVSSLCVSRNLEIILVGSYKNQKIVILNKLKPVTLLSNKNNVSKYTTITVSPNEKLVCTGDSNGILQLWSLNSGISLVFFHNHYKCILKTIFIKKSSRFILSCSSDGSLKIFDLKKLIIVKTLENNANFNRFELFDVNYSNKLLIGSCESNQQLHIWSLKTGNLIEIIPNAKFTIISLQFLRKKNQFISNDKNGYLKLWNLYLVRNSSLKIGCKTIHINIEILALTINPLLDELVVFSVSGVLLIMTTDKFEMKKKIMLYPKLLNKVFCKNIPFKEKTIIKYSNDGKFLFLNNKEQNFLILIENSIDFEINERNSKTNFKVIMGKNFFPFKLQNLFYNKNSNRNHKIIEVQSFCRGKNWIVLFDNQMLLLGVNNSNFELRKNYFLGTLESCDIYSNRVIQNLVFNGYLYLLKKFFNYFSSKRKRLYFIIFSINSNIKNFIKPVQK